MEASNKRMQRDAAEPHRCVRSIERPLSQSGYFRLGSITATTRLNKLAHFSSESGIANETL
jgi:hypothetical protein